VAIAISIGGPGATFWMIVAGFLGMTTKFTEATLAQRYREVRPDGRIMGGPMEYLSKGFAEYNWPRTGKFLAGMFAIFAVLLLALPDLLLHPRLGLADAGIQLQQRRIAIGHRSVEFPHRRVVLHLGLLPLCR
jgi:hypothetical protein